MYGAPFFCILSISTCVFCTKDFHIQHHRRCCIMFADRAKVFIKSGKGGDGHVSFRRELYVPNGGPDGGDGGRGGDVIFQVDTGKNTLVDFRHIHKYVAKDGQEGGKRRCHGADADDLIVKVPGTAPIFLPACQK